MINVSKEFQLLMNERTDFTENAQITFANGTVINLTEKDFTISNNRITDAAETNGIPLGIAICRNIQIELMNDDDRFSQYDFFGAKIKLYLSFKLSETTEKIECGTFTVLTPETYGETVIITALDDMHKADKEYNTGLVFPTTIGNMLRDACTTLGISQGTTTFLNDDFVIDEKPTEITFRQLIGYIAMIAGGNARIDTTGRLRIHSYDFANMESIYNSVLNGGSYNPWDNPVNVDGGSFAPWDTRDSVDGGAFGDRNHFHVLGNWSYLKVDTDDVVITGVKTNYYDEENNEQSVIYGVDGYVLLIENPLIAGKEQEAVNLIGNVMVGGRFRQFSGDLVSNPTCEFMDHALLLDRKGNVYISFITDVDFQFFGFTSIKNSAEPTLRNSARGYSELVKTLVVARKLVAEERTARERAVEQLAKDLQESSGLFMTQEPQADGSIIYYMHDKPTLKESMVVWKLTALAFAVSTDGGKTYPYGFTVNGETITRLLYAEGIDADYITSGTIDADKINVINVVAKSVAAEDITGDTFTGKKYISNVALGDYDNQTTIDGATITAKLTNDTLKSVLNYNGLTVSASSGSLLASMTYSGISIKGNSGYKSGMDAMGISIESSGSKSTFTYDTLSIKQNSSNVGIELTKTGKIESRTASGYTAITGHQFESNYGVYSSTTIEGKTIKSYAGVNDYLTVNGAEIYLYNGTTDNLTIGPKTIKYSSAELIAFASNSVTVKSTNTFLGSSTGNLGFFGTSTKSTKKSVTSITTPANATASSVATKLNELLTALKAYNLIG